MGAGPVDQQRLGLVSVRSTTAGWTSGSGRRGVGAPPEPELINHVGTHGSPEWVPEGLINSGWGV